MKEGPSWNPGQGCSPGKGPGGVSPAWNSCGCPCGILTGNPARPAGRTDTPCEENKEKELEKEQRKERNRQMSRVPGRRQPRPPAGGAQQAQGSEGRLSPPPGSPVPARPASTSHTPRAVRPALYKMGNPLGNSPNSPANRSYCYYTRFRDGQTDPEATQRRVTQQGRG